MIKENQFYLPAEWDQHSATQLHWPTNNGKWPASLMDELEQMYCKIIEELHFFEVIHLFVENLAARDRVMNRLSLKAVDLDRIVIHQRAINDIWARDCGPMFVKDAKGDQLILNWGFNGWGEKYVPWSDDDIIPAYVAKKFNLKCIDTGMILECGSIDVNGEGALLTTESVLLNKNRNPGLLKGEITQKLEEYLGAEQIIWLKGGLSNDGRDGQIQNITRWLNKNTVLTMVTQDETYSDYDILWENLEILRNVTLNNGKKLNVEVLELSDQNNADKRRIDFKLKPLSYTGFYIANGCVLVPQYNDVKKDNEAKNLLVKYFPGRKIIPIDCTALSYRSSSGLHGITQQWKGITY